jgi:hypothetical protein
MEVPKDLKKLFDSRKTKEPLGFLGLFQLLDNSMASFLEKITEGEEAKFNYGYAYLLMEVIKCNNSLYDKLFFDDFEKNTRILECTFSLCEKEFTRLTEYISDNNIKPEDGLIECLPYVVGEGSCVAISAFVLSFRKFLPNYELKNEIYNYTHYARKEITINYPETETKIDFNPSLFKDDYSTRLFCYIVDSYHNGKDKELSNIYQWMENNGFIQENKRKEYKDLVKEYSITKQKYSRVHPSTEYTSSKLDPTFNDLKKRFDLEIH